MGDPEDPLCGEGAGEVGGGQEPGGTGYSAPPPPPIRVRGVKHVHCTASSKILNQSGSEVSSTCTVLPVLKYWTNQSPRHVRCTASSKILDQSKSEVSSTCTVLPALKY